MIEFSRRAALAVALVLALVVVHDVAAGEPSDQLRRQIDRALKTIGDPALRGDTKARERRDAVRQVANDIFDFAETARRSLAQHWLSRTPAEREEFVHLFSDLLERSYVSRIELYGGEQIIFLGDSVDGNVATVRTKIATKQGSDIPIDYRMSRHGDRWLVYDVVIEGVSLVANYRTQFNKIIRTSSYRELVKKMRDKQDEFREEEQGRRTSQK